MKLPKIKKKTYNINLIFYFKRNKLYKKIKNLRTIEIKFEMALKIIERNDY